MVASPSQLIGMAIALSIILALATYALIRPCLPASMRSSGGSATELPVTLDPNRPDQRPIATLPAELPLVQPLVVPKAMGEHDTGSPPLSDTGTGIGMGMDKGNVEESSA